MDLRRDELQHNIRLRSLTANTVRNYLTENGFTEIETPTLFKSTPEGAREFIVPTRKRGAFYALPQSPQQVKRYIFADDKRAAINHMYLAQANVDGCWF